MTTHRRILGCIAVACSLFATSSLAGAYSITQVGTQSVSDLPGVPNGQTYELTLVFDNGGTSPASQTWNGASLQCAIWKLNTSRNIVYTQDAVANPFGTIVGTATTNAGGLLRSNFTNINDNSAGGVGSTLTGATFITASWYANNGNDIFFTDQGRFGDASGGVQMAAAGWTNPVPFSGNCAGRMLVGGGPLVVATAVPTLSEWAMILFGTLLAGGAALLVQRQRIIT